MSRPLVRCSEQCGQQTLRKSSSVTNPCDMLAAWKLLEVLSSMDLTLLDKEVWTELAAIPLRAKMSSKTLDVLVARHVEDSSFHKARWEALTNARLPMQRHAASSAEDKVSIQSPETDGSEENMIRLTGLLRRLCEYSAQLPLVLVQDYTDEVLWKSTAMLEAGLKAQKECTCNVQPLQELAHEATLNFSLDETISAMMMHIGDAVQSTGKTVFKAAALFGTLLLASDVTGPSDGAPAVAEALEELAAFDRHHTGFRLVEGHEKLFQTAYENLETRVAAEFESYSHGALPLPPRTFVSISCWVQEPLTQNVQITQKAHVLEELLHRWKSLGNSTEGRAVADCNISNNTFTTLTRVRHQQEGLLALLAWSSHAKTMPCFTSTRSVLDRAATTVQEVATFKLRCAWADLEHKEDDLRPLAGGSPDGGSWKTAIEENKTFDQNSGARSATVDFAGP